MGTVTMPRPKKPRLVDGIVLHDRLFQDCRKRPGHWRWRRPDGTFKTFRADTPEEANSLVEAALNFDPPPTGATIRKDSLEALVPLFIEHRQKLDPSLKQKTSWKNRRNALKAFARYFSGVGVGKISRPMIVTWWEGLTFHQQKQRHTECRRLFNWLMGEGLCPQLEYNPFTTADDRPRLMLSGQAPKARMRMDRADFWAIYHQAGELGLEGLQIAMGISLTTFMRESDILALRLDEDLEGDLLKKVISKSAQQKGSARAARLKWDVANHRLLKQLLARARVLSIKHFRCPYVISHRPLKKRRGAAKDHPYQVTRWRLAEMFAEARDATRRWDIIQEGRTPPTFHEVRSLADRLAVDAGYDIKTIQGVMAHESDVTTKDYLDGHQLPFDQVDIVFTEEMIGGSF